jgi:cAMP-binding proteins - catabolite gene activator and regulatory subunit of cAMP-dependent protein kinases
MPTPKRSAPNRLLARLPARYRDEFVAACETVELPFEATLVKTGETLQHAYFPLRGFISQIAPVDRSSIEVGLIGNEGMLGVQLALGVARSPMTSLVQGQGEALRMPSRQFRAELERSAPLRQEISRYTFVVMNQMARNAGCNRFHVVESRLARWLVMTADRAHSNAFSITQAFLASMLGVRRVGVTVAAGNLQARGLIRSLRGKVEIVDPEGLREAACSCYRADLATYRDTLS